MIATFHTTGSLCRPNSPNLLRLLLFVPQDLSVKSMREFSTMRFRWLSFLICLGAAMAQTSKPTGDYSGVLGPLHLKLHLKAGTGGAVEGTLDSIDQQANGLACANFRLQEKTLSFDVPSVGGKWHGTVSDDGARLTGTWSQGQDMPLLFQRDEAFAAAETVGGGRYLVGNH